jgi:GNAT superfamily N-acetyltransferase
LVSSVSWNEENILNDSAAPERSIVCRQRLTNGNLGFMSPFVRSPAMNDLSIRTMRPDEISIAVNWAAAEGWNPGLADDACFAAVDPEGFLIGELDGAPAATVSCVNYSASFAFLGFYIVREDLRGRGYGLRIWDAAIAHAGPRVIGLDGVVAQQQNYRKSGFELAYANVRYGGIVAAPDAPQAGVMALAEVPLAAVEAYDAMVFPAPRPAFLRAWIGSPWHVGCARTRDGRLVGWGVIRPCRKGCKIGSQIELLDGCHYRRRGIRDRLVHFEVRIKRPELANLSVGSPAQVAGWARLWLPYRSKALGPRSCSLSSLDFCFRRPRGDAGAVAQNWVPLGA